MRSKKIARNGRAGISALIADKFRVCSAPRIHTPIVGWHVAPMYSGKTTTAVRAGSPTAVKGKIMGHVDGVRKAVTFQGRGLYAFCFKGQCDHCRKPCN